MAAANRRFHLSTRSRLTAWYAALLVLLLLCLGVSVSALTQNRLAADVDSRIVNTAEDIAVGIENRASALPPFTIRRVSDDDVFPILGSFASRGLLIQIVSPAGEVIRGSEFAPPTPLVPVPDDPEAGPTFATTMLDGDEVRLVSYPLIVSDAVDSRWYFGTIIVGERLLTMHQTLDSLRQVLLVTSALGLTLAIVGGWALAGRALRPVDRVTAAAAAIAAGDGTATSLRSRLPVPPTNDELSRLSATFNAMLSRLEGSFRAQERFVADASHELRTPLTAIRGNVDVLIRQLGGSRRPIDAELLAESLADVRRESDRMRRLLDDLLLLARSDAGSDPARFTGLRPVAVRLDAIAAEAVRSATALADGQTIELEAPRGVAIQGDPDRLHQLLVILLDNAIRHTPAGGHIRVAVAAAPDGTARLAVRDEGEGIAPEHLPHLFERFYRADGARGRASGGTGLGLAIARAICRAHGGEIAVTSTPGAGATFMITLPGAGVIADAIERDAHERSPIGDRSPADVASLTDYREKKISAAPIPPTINTNAIGTISPSTDSLRNPRP
jgi:two-component system, OmpR family, sensor kinase